MKLSYALIMLLLVAKSHCTTGAVTFLVQVANGIVQVPAPGEVIVDIGSVQSTSNAQLEEQIRKINERRKKDQQDRLCCFFCCPCWLLNRCFSE